MTNENINKPNGRTPRKFAYLINSTVREHKISTLLTPT